MTSATDNLSEDERDRLEALESLRFARRALRQAERALAGAGTVPLPADA